MRGDKKPVTQTGQTDSLRTQGEEEEGGGGGGGVGRGKKKEERRKKKEEEKDAGLNFRKEEETRLPSIIFVIVVNHFGLHHRSYRIMSTRY